MINVFGGGGFVGSHYVKIQPDCKVNLKADYNVTSREVVDFISTVDNYNVYDNPHLDIATNLTITIKLLESWRKYQETNEEGEEQMCGHNGCFNYISTWFVYGNGYHNKGAVETDPCNPQGFYSITKRAAEQLIISYCQTYNLNYRIMRLAGVIGPGDIKVSAKKNALQYLIAQMKAGNNIELYDSGNFYRDYIDVEDVAVAIKLLIDKSEVNKIYNIGSGCAYNFRSLIEHAHKEMKSTSAIIDIPQKDFHKVVQTKSFYMDTSLLQSYGFKRKYTIEQSLDKVIAGA